MRSDYIQLIRLILVSADDITHVDSEMDADVNVAVKKMSMSYDNGNYWHVSNLGFMLG